MIFYKRLPNGAALRVLYAACALVLFSCATLPPERTTISRSLTGKGVVPAERLAAFLRENNASVPHRDALYLARCYISEAADEGINSDVAFAQMCLETGFLKFGGLVTADMHNYCGLGAIDEAHRGDSFETVQLGVRAHIQHLNAYGDTDELVNPVVDKRARFVTPRGKAPTILELAGTWAQDAAYGTKLDNILTRMEQLR
ncbi:MAG: glucosaminidase domain-containing protein [Treponema sp.]|nr:glucosaminidase domain-containing protein [Treponema sp.]